MQRNQASLTTMILLAAAQLLPTEAAAEILTPIASFGTADGIGPAGPLLQVPDGSFYGVTIGTAGSLISNLNIPGTIFRVSPDGALKTLYTFALSAGAPQNGLTLGPDGNLYGSIAAAGAGAIFKATLGGDVTFLHTFSGTDGASPNGLLVAGADGALYGTTAQGGDANLGTVFRITPDGTFTVLHSFKGFDGSTPNSLLLAKDGFFYGSTSAITTIPGGTVFRISADGTFASLHKFGPTAPDPLAPSGPLIEVGDGKFYGLSCRGGSMTIGTVFEVTAAGSITVIHNFVPNEGGCPVGGLFHGSDGLLYGVTAAYGPGGAGTLFKMTTTGTLTVVQVGTITGGGVGGALMQGSDGNFYGVIGAGSRGVSSAYVFRFPPATNSFGPPVIAPGGVAPIYSKSTFIETGEWVSIYGTNLANNSAIWNGDFPTSLGGVSVTVDGISAYLWYVGPGQINMQVPDRAGTAGNSFVPVVVSTASGTAVLNVQMRDPSPSLSLLDQRHVAGIILRQDGSGLYGDGTYDILGPAGNSLGFATIPARAGDRVAVFGTGFGPTNPSVPAGHPFTGAAPLNSPVTISINGVTVFPTFAGLSGAGLDQVNFTIPGGLGTGDVPIQLIVAGQSTQNSVVISVQ